MPMPGKLTTPKDFYMLPQGTALTRQPSGVYEYQRVLLARLLPGLGNLDLWHYYYLRIACCGTLLVKGPTRLRDCERCHDNRGYVCPRCLGATFTRYSHDNGASRLPCTGCRVESIDEKGKLVTHYSAVKELETVRHWLMRRFPMGVSISTARDLDLADAATVSHDN
jgi:hypothetical protein